MTICSLVLQAIPEQIPAVTQTLESIEGVEIHASNEFGKLVVTIDHPERKYCSHVMNDMTRISGVMSTSLVYEYQEDLDEPEVELKVVQEIKQQEISIEEIR